MTDICKRFRVFGEVQGVFFRYSTQKKAVELGLIGWVKNQDDGSVELIACGDQERLAILEQWLWQGPPAAKVELVRVEEMEWEAFSKFIIKH